MKYRVGVLALVFCILAIATGVAQDVRYNFDRKADFSKYKTYKWVEIRGAERFNDMVDRQLKDAVDAQLSTKGLQRTEDENADLYIGYQAALTAEKEFTSYSSDFGYGPGWGRWYGAGGMSTTHGETNTIQIGHLDLQMYDREAKAIVWRGSASKTLDPKAKPDKQQKNLTKAIAKLLKDYPPQGK